MIKASESITLSSAALQTTRQGEMTNILGKVCFYIINQWFNNNIFYRLQVLHNFRYKAKAFKNFKSKHTCFGIEIL